MTLWKISDMEEVPFWPSWRVLQKSCLLLLCCWGREWRCWRRFFQCSKACILNSIEAAWIILLLQFFLPVSEAFMSPVRMSLWNVSSPRDFLVLARRKYIPYPLSPCSVPSVIISFLVAEKFYVYVNVTSFHINKNENVDNLWLAE